VVRVSVRNRRSDGNWVNQDKKLKGTKKKYTEVSGQQMRKDRKRKIVGDEKELKELRVLKIKKIVFSFYQLDEQTLYFNTFITFLYMFRALLCSSSGGQLY